MNIEELLEQLNKYAESKEHLYDCIGYGEGQLCCLDKKWIKSFIEKVYATGYGQGLKMGKVEGLAEHLQQITPELKNFKWVESCARFAGGHYCFHDKEGNLTL